MLIVGCGRWGSIFTNNLEINHVVLGTNSEINLLAYSPYRTSSIIVEFDKFIDCAITEIHKHDSAILVLPPTVRVELLSKLGSYHGKIYIEKPAATSIQDLDKLSKLELDINIMFKYRSTTIFRTILDNFAPACESYMSLCRPKFRPGINNWRVQQSPIIEELIHFVDFAEQLHKSNLNSISLTRPSRNIRLDLLFENQTSSVIDFAFWEDEKTQKKIIVDNSIFGNWEFSNGRRNQSLTADGYNIEILSKDKTIFASCLENCCKLSSTLSLHQKVLEIL
jgi:hypothetical protein